MLAPQVEPEEALQDKDKSSNHSTRTAIFALADDMTMLSEGRIDISGGGAGSKDEIGMVAGAVEIFRQAAIDKKHLEQDAEG